MHKVIVSDRAKRMLGTHIRFMAHVSKGAAAVKKKEMTTAMRSLSQIPQRFPFFEEMYGIIIEVVTFSKVAFFCLKGSVKELEVR